MKTPEHILERNRNYRHSETGGKSPLNVLKERYKSMVQRCYLDRHSSTPEGLCSRKAFLDFGMNNNEYHRLYVLWKEQGFPRGQSPSVDRIDVKRGYSLDNIQFLPFVDNIAKSHVELTRQKISVILKKEEEEYTFSSGAEASRWLGVKRSEIGTACRLGTRVKGWSAYRENTPTGKQRRHKKVVLLNIHTNEEETFINVSEAAHFIDIAESTLRLIISKDYITKKTWKARYKE